MTAADTSITYGTQEEPDGQRKPYTGCPERVQCDALYMLTIPRAAYQTLGWSDAQSHYMAC